MTDYGKLLLSRLEMASVRAFLAVIKASEGTAGPNAYNIEFGGTKSHPILFTGYADHPRHLNTANGLSSDAAGAYQFMSKTWDEDKAALDLPDFSPTSQDIACLYEFSKANALADVEEGRFYTAIEKCNKTWASLPGSPYGQPTQPLSYLAEIYGNGGGSITDNIA